MSGPGPSTKRAGPLATSRALTKKLPHSINRLNVPGACYADPGGLLGSMRLRDVLIKCMFVEMVTKWAMRFAVKESAVLLSGKRRLLR